MQTSKPLNNELPPSTPTPVIAALEKLIAETESAIEQEQRQKTLSAVLCVADAWQILVRARQPLMAKAIDTVAQDRFLSSWASVAAETFMRHVPERRKSRGSSDENDSPRSTCSEPEAMDTDETAPAKVDSAVDEDRTQAIESAQWRIAQAWILLEELQEGGTDAEAIRNLGVACFGESQFCDAMVEARAQRSKQAE